MDFFTYDLQVGARNGEVMIFQQGEREEELNSITIALHQVEWLIQALRGAELQAMAQAYEQLPSDE